MTKQELVEHNWSKPASKDIIDKTILALNENGITAHYAENSESARAKVLSLLPKGAEVMTMTSITLEQTGIKKEIDESGNFNSIRDKFNKMDRTKDKREMKVLGSSPKYVIGSVQAVTEDGKVLIASNTGSQLPAYAYGSDHVIWVVGTNKIVSTIEEGMKRLYDYTLLLENTRVQKAYGMKESFISKLLIFNREHEQGRVNIIFVNENLGY